MSKFIVNTSAGFFHGRDFHATDRKPGEPLTDSCEHRLSEDCMNCRKCGKCSETIDDDDLCDACR